MVSLLTKTHDNSQSNLDKDIWVQENGGYFDINKLQNNIIYCIFRLFIFLKFVF